MGETAASPRLWKVTKARVVPSAAVDGASSGRAGDTKAGNPLAWAVFGLLALMSFGLLLGIAWGLVRIVSPVAPTTSGEVTLIGRNFERSRSPGSGTTTRLLVYEVVGVTGDDRAFTLASKELYDAVDGRLPIQATAETVVVTGEVVRVGVDGVEGGGRAGTSVVALVATLMMVPVLGVIVYGVVTSNLSTPAYGAALAVGAAVALWLALGWAREPAATAEQLRARDLGAPLESGTVDDDLEIDVDVEVPDLTLDLDS